MIERIAFLTMMIGAIGVPGAMVLWVFISTLGPEKPADQEATPR